MIVKMPNDRYTLWSLIVSIMQPTCKSLFDACHTGHLVLAPRIKFVCKVVLEVKHADREVKKIVFPIMCINYKMPVSVYMTISFV